MSDVFLRVAHAARVLVSAASPKQASCYQGELFCNEGEVRDGEPLSPTREPRVLPRRNGMRNPQSEITDYSVVK
jgi:hypothetical protein